MRHVGHAPGLRSRGDLTETELNDLRVLGERYCRPVVARTSPVGANA